ncbi:hypothetical protein D3C81_1415590 [compost metagenome]
MRACPSCARSPPARQRPAPMAGRGCTCTSASSPSSRKRRRTCWSCLCQKASCRVRGRWRFTAWPVTSCACRARSTTPIMRRASWWVAMSRITPTARPSRKWRRMDRAGSTASPVCIVPMAAWDRVAAGAMACRRERTSNITPRASCAKPACTATASASTVPCRRLTRMAS